LLDGGISSQMAVREHDGTVTRWPNLRPVPLGMVVMGRENRLAVRSATPARAVRPEASTSK
jgi:hypothetical protein